MPRKNLPGRYTQAGPLRNTVMAISTLLRSVPDVHEIRQLLAQGPAAPGYRIPRLTWYLGRWIRGTDWYPDHQLRFFRRHAGRFVPDAVHESVRLDGRVETLTEPLLHHSYRGVEDFVQRSNRYSTLAAGEWVRRGKRAGLADLIFRPLGRFLSMYIIQRGFLDGWRGFVLAVLYADYVFLRIAKAWEARILQDERQRGA